MIKGENNLKKGDPISYLNAKGEESHAFFISNNKEESALTLSTDTITLSTDQNNKIESASFSVPEYLVYEPNNDFEKKTAQLFFNIDENVQRESQSKDDTHIDKSVFDDITLASIKHTYKVLNTPSFARPILGAKKRASKNIVDLAEKFNLRILIDAINAIGVIKFDKGLTEQELTNAEEMASKIDGFLKVDIQDNPNAKAALLSKNVVDSLGTSAHYAIKLNSILHASIKAVIENKISAYLNIPKNQLIAEDRVINLTRSLVDKWVSESLKNSSSDLIQEYSNALDNQFKSNITNVPLNLLEDKKNKFKGLFLFSQVMLINKLKTLENTLENTLGKTLDESKLKLMSTSTATLNNSGLKESSKKEKKPHNVKKVTRSNSMTF